MNDITRTMQFRTPTDRQADALEELRRLHRDHELLTAKCRQQDHVIGQLQFRVEFLTDQVAVAQQNERTATRKLVRLADRVALMGQLSVEATEIVRSADDWNEVERAHEEQRDAAHAAAGLPQVADAHAEIDDRINRDLGDLVKQETDQLVDAPAGEPGHSQDRAP